MAHKTIFSGRLEFGTPRSFSRMMTMLENRVENHYRNVVLIKWDAFLEEESALDVPRLIAPEATDKEWRNTIDMLRFIVQYAVAGNIDAWMLAGGKVLQHHLIEPDSDKAAVQAYLKGRELLEVEGKEEEARQALSRAIEKFERHARAYERRGYVNMMLQNDSDALYDYSKSIKIDPKNAESRLGRAILRIKAGELELAIDDLAQAIKNSIPHQPTFWQGRRMKGECHLKLGQYEKAAFELKFVTKREFKGDNPNYKWRKRASFNYGRALLELGRYEEALQAFDQAICIGDVAKEVPDSDLLLYRGLAMKGMGQSGFKNVWKDAAAKGSQRAAELLEEAV